MVNRTRTAQTLVRWLDSSSAPKTDEADLDRVDWLRTLPYIGMHLAVLGVFWVGWSPVAVGVAIALYVIRMLVITGFYHRYFSHRSFRTSRPVRVAS